MIVYTGKQYGNNFNNGDEALFQDANRPRDNDKFKLRPGLQSDKRKQREVNKDITTVASQLLGWGQTNIGAIANDGYFIPKFEQKYKSGNPGCIINDDGNMEITEDGTYIIQASCQFTYSSAPSSSVIEIIYLLKQGDSGWNVITMNQGRASLTTDLVTVTFYSWYKKGDVFNLKAGHSLNAQVYLYGVLNIQRLA